MFANLTAAKYGGGLCALFLGQSHDNTISSKVLNIENNTAGLGGGILILLDDSSSGNRFYTTQTFIIGNRAMIKGWWARSLFGNHGSGLAALCLGHAQNNTILLRGLEVGNNSAELGGGIMLSLGDFARDNKIILNYVSIFNNKAYAGGGMYTKFHFHPLPECYWMTTLPSSEEVPFM